MPTALIKVHKVVRLSQLVAIHYPSAADPMDIVIQENAIHAAKKQNYWIEAEDDTFSCELSQTGTVIHVPYPTEGV